MGDPPPAGSARMHIKTRQLRSAWFLCVINVLDSACCLGDVSFMRHRLDVFAGYRRDVEGAIAAHAFIFPDIDQEAVIRHEIAVELIVAVNELAFCDHIFFADGIGTVQSIVQ